MEGRAWTKFGFLGGVLPNLGTPTTFRRTFGKKRDGTLRGAVQLCMQMTIFYSWCYYLLLMDYDKCTGGREGLPTKVRLRIQSKGGSKIPIVLLT